MKQQIMPEDIKSEIASDAMKGIVVTVMGRSYTIHELLGEPGKAGVTRKCTDEIGIDYAIKFTTYSSYDERKSYLDEVQKATMLRGCPNIARLEGWGELDLELPKSKKSVHFVILIFEFVSGVSLKSYLEKNSVAPSFINAFISGLCEALQAFHFNNLFHNDLHDGNIMICPPYRGSLNPNARIVKIIDTGSISSVSDPIEKEWDDNSRLIDNICKIYNRSLEYRWSFTSSDIVYMDEILKILNIICEEDSQRRLSQPMRIKEEFDRAWEESIKGTTNRSKELSLKSPFDYIQAEHIINDELLARLFSDKCPWYNLVSGPDPINLDGPRGCGKSTVFRMLRLKTLMNIYDPSNLSKIEQIGFFISCTSEIGSRFNSVGEDEAYYLEDEIIHYFNLVLLSEIISALREIDTRKDLGKVIGWSNKIAQDIHNCIMDMMQISGEEDTFLSGMSWIDHIRHIIDKERLKTHISILKKEKIAFSTPPSLLDDIVQCLVDNIPFFKQRIIMFLLDDYSLHRVPEYIQRILNKVIWTQVSNYVFKISSEVGGVVALAPFGGTADISREFKSVNAGLQYINMHEANNSEDFIADVLNRRLELAKYKGDVKKLLGVTKYPDGMTLGMALHLESRGKLPGKPVYYHGIKCISDLCSGDIATILDIVRCIFEDASVSSSTIMVVSSYKQHRAIQAFSWDLYSRISDYIPHGNIMQKIVHDFGWMARELLFQHELVPKGEGRFDPYEMIRIELDEDPDRPELPEYHKVVIHELLRRSIFIELEKGRSIRGTITRKLQLRRAYCPAFKISLAHSEPFKLSRENIRRLINNPSDICETYLKTTLGKPVSLKKNLDQLPMLEVLETEAQGDYP